MTAFPRSLGTGPRWLSVSVTPRIYASLQGRATPTHHHGHNCLRLRVYVCCSTVSQTDDDSNQTPPEYTVRPNIKIHNIDEFNPEVPKLEKSVSGSSPSRDRLLITIAALLASAMLLS
ncbi:unnamed protein product [Merluccius merluccius]